jgi:hypothetical protein
MKVAAEYRLLGDLHLGACLILVGKIKCFTFSTGTQGLLLAAASFVE